MYELCKKTNSRFVDAGLKKNDKKKKKKITIIKEIIIMKQFKNVFENMKKSEKTLCSVEWECFLIESYCSYWYLYLYTVHQA